MSFEDVRVDLGPAIHTPAEKPISAGEWLQAAVEISVLILVILPTWTLLGLVLIGPAVLLKNYSNQFSEANQKIINRLYAFAREIFEILSAGSNYFSAYWKPIENVEQKGRPILLVHGYLYNASGWTRMLKRLSEKGIGPIYTINLGHPFLPLSEYAKRVDEKAKEIRRACGRDDLVLIGHSMGGVVSSLYATKLAPEGSVTDVFTLGSPLYGSRLARTLGVGPSGREMRPDAPLLAEIRNSMKANQKIRFYHAGSDADLLVSADSALSGCGKQLRVADLGHMGMLTSGKIADWIATELAHCLINS